MNEEWRNELITKGAAFDALTEVESHYEFEDGHDHLMGWAKTKIFALPSTQPDTARRIVGKSRDGMTLWYQCDMCNEPIDEQDTYCRGCGRRLIDE